MTDGEFNLQIYTSVKVSFFETPCTNTNTSHYTNTNTIHDTNTDMSVDTNTNTTPNVLTDDNF